MPVNWSYNVTRQEFTYSFTQIELKHALPPAADGLVLFHLAFILFVLFGGLLTLKWPRVMWLHLPAVAWGISVEVLPCPLTRWENLFRHLAGQDGYGGGFIEHYILTLIYPAGLTANINCCWEPWWW